MEVLLAATDSILSGAIEVGIGIVGFTGVIVAVAGGRKRSNLWTVQFQTLLFTAIATIMFSFLPFLVMQFGFIGRQLWMICSGVYLIYLPIILLIRAKQFSKTEEDAPNEFGGPYRLLYGFGLGLLVMGLLQILNLSVFQTYWPYLIMVIYYVFFSLSVFAVITLALWNGDENA
jgi:hypothetical protein